MWTNEFVNVKTFGAKAKQGPFQKCRLFTTLHSFELTAFFFFFLQQLGKSWVLGTSQMFWGVSVQIQRSFGWGGGSKRKQFSFPWFLSISVNLHYVCECYAKLLYIWENRLYFNILCNLGFHFLSSPLFYCQVADLSNLCCKDKLWPSWKFHHLRKGKL